MSKSGLPEVSGTLPNGLELSFRPTWETREERSKFGPFEFELQSSIKTSDEASPDEEYFLASVKIRYEVRGTGKDRTVAMILTAQQGESLKVQGEGYRFSFQGTHPSFYPAEREWWINGLHPKTFKVEMPNGALASLRLDFARVKPPGDVGY